MEHYHTAELNESTLGVALLAVEPGPKPASLEKDTFLGSEVELIWYQWKRARREATNCA